MSIKASVSITEEQDSFARDLVTQGQFPSVSAVIQHGIELMRAKVEMENLEREALRSLLTRRQQGAFIDGEEMESVISRLAQKRRQHNGI
ncbi:type II toxin-antitoxin system ParD family antitoxin [Parvularcula sp. IMCC14364]|uniref:type II toxin-antitoxin system ParD family antitoxin n=1 Tax=Parvularcula sp. IMCC14364 TaxID=3067902 RepID=UPI002741D349|nr:type II toxin-antitoxin system ParD family antitoxin [Parvularcula sp. IMCC14364]